MTEPAIKVIAMPSDTNPDGDIFGGWILSQMDLAGYLTARKIARKKLVTVAMDNIVFHAPVFVGDCLECYTQVEKQGRTSITVMIEAYVERRDSKPSAAKEKVTEGRFIFVAIDKETRKPSPIEA